MPRKAKRFSDEDQAFLTAQAEAIGCDVDTYLCMVVRQMRLGQLPTLAFGQKASAVAERPRFMEELMAERGQAWTGREWSPSPAVEIGPEQWGAPAPLPEQNAPAEEFNFNTAEAVQPAQTAQPETASLVDEIARITSGVAQDSFSGARGSPASSASVTSLRRSLKASAAPISGPPGSATRILGPGRGISADQQGDGRGNVQRQNFKHMYGR